MMREDAVDAAHVAAGHELELEHTKAFYRYRLFFCSLVFAILSFAIQFSVKSDCNLLRVLEGCGWIFLLLCGFLSIRELGGFRLKNIYIGLSPKWQFAKYALFVVAMLLLIISKLFSK